MELGADDICAPCKHNTNGLCDDIIDTSFRPAAPKSKREWNLVIDKRWCERLKLKQGDRLTAREFCQLLQDNTDDITDIYREISAGSKSENTDVLVYSLVVVQPQRHSPGHKIGIPVVIVLVSRGNGLNVEYIPNDG